MRVLAVMKRPVRLKAALGAWHEKRTCVGISQTVFTAEKALTGRSWAMLKWLIQSNGFWHEKNNVGGHVFGIGGVWWAIS